MSKFRINKYNCLKFGFYYITIFVFGFWFLIFNFSFAESLPPLPLKDLIKIDLKYNDTLIKPIPLDSFRIKVYGGNVLGGNILFNHTLRKHTLLKLNASGGRYFDYSNYLWEKSNILLGYLYGDFWQEISLATMWKKRAQRYYDYLQLSYSPVLFVANGTITLHNAIRKAQYFDDELNNFLSLQSSINYNTPSPIGIVNTNIEILSQAKDLETPLTNISGDLKDLITIGDNFYINPSLAYDIKQKRLTVNTNLGFLISSLITNIDIKHNAIEKYYFDSLYADVFSYLASEDVDYPICQWKFGASIQWHNFKLGGYYHEYRSFINWTQQDTWIKPEFVDSPHTQIGINFSGKWRFLENYLDIRYVPDPKNLMPAYLVSDSVSVKLNNWELITGLWITGKRIWYDQTLPKNIIVMSQLGYQWRLIKIFTRIENILNNKYEILQNHFDKGIKYSVGLELLK